MPKRSADEKIERYQRKIQKLHEKKAKKHKRVRVVYSDSSEDERTEVGRTDVEIHNDPQAATTAVSNHVAEQSVHAQASRLDSTAADQAITDSANLVQENMAEEPATATDTVQTDETMSEPVLDPELLEALGESTSDTPEYGAKIHENLANLWLPLLRKGMVKDVKEKTLKDYLIPDNCRLLQSPKLNPEISAAVPDIVRNRDKGLAVQQQQLGSGITAVNRALDLLLKGEDKKLAIQHLSNSCRILSDLHSTFTQNRIKLISSCLDKKFLNVIQDSQRDETLFGNKLSDKIKAANAIQKQGQQIRKTYPKNTNASQSAAYKASSSGNWTHPSRFSSNRGGRGGSRKPPAQKRRYYPNSTQSPQPKPALETMTKPRAPPAQ